MQGRRTGDIRRRRRCLDGAAAAAGLRAVRALDLVLRLEGRVAAAARRDVRVVEPETGADQAVAVVDRRARQVGQADRIDHHAHAVALDLEVVWFGARVEADRVLESRAAAALDGDAQHARLLVLSGQALDVFGGLV